VANEPEQLLRQVEKARAIVPEFEQSTSTSVAILNGFGRTLGDSIIGLQALSVAIRIGAIPARTTLFRLPHLPLVVQATYEVAEFVRLRTLPWELSTRDRRFDPGGPVGRVIDLRDFAFDPEFQQASMIDFFLRRLGVSPSSISTCDKRNSWLAPRVTRTRQLFPAGYVLICPHSSVHLREMPKAVHARILREAFAVGPVVTQGQVPDELVGRATHAMPCKTLEDLCGLVRHARLIISTDTAMVHLADAFDVPCVAFFPTHDPEWRVRDYPKCRAIRLRSRLPPGLEFARGPRDEEEAHAAWFRDPLAWSAS
jgi:hypothetical protein